MKTIQWVRGLFFACVAASVGGCVHYEYNIVSPPDLREHVGTRNWVTVPFPPVSYRFITSENHLVIEVYNPQPGPVRVRGDESFVVDPHRQSHPLRSQSIAPGSFIRIIFPPVIPTYRRTGPSIGFGIGGGFGGGRHFRSAWSYYTYDPWWDEPRYYAVYDPGNDFYWDWDGQTDVQLTLVLQGVDNKPVTHSFDFHRQRM